MFRNQYGLPTEPCDLIRTILTISPNMFGFLGEPSVDSSERLASNLFTSTSLIREKVPVGTTN